MLHTGMGVELSRIRVEALRLEAGRVTRRAREGSRVRKGPVRAALGTVVVSTGSRLLGEAEVR